MGAHLDGSRGGGVSRLEVIEGPSGRCRRTKAERARIAAESPMAGVTVGAQAHAPEHVVPGGLPTARFIAVRHRARTDGAAMAHPRLSYQRP